MSDNQSTSLLVLLVEADDESRPLLVENLTNRGCQVTTVLNPTEAISRARLDPAFDLILVNQYQVSAEEAIELGQRIRAEGGMPEQVPVIILADEYGEELEGQNRCVDPACYVAYLSMGQQLWDLIDSLCR